MISRYILSLFMAIGLFTMLAPQAHAQAKLPSDPSQLFMTTPISKPDGSRWRVGYLESGNYSEYPLTLAAIAEGLQRLGWLAIKEDIPKGMGGHALWTWLSRNTTSQQLEFVEDAWWQPGDFDADKRPVVREAIMNRVQQAKDIDLILAMGTWAGQDMRAIGPPVPTIVASTSDPLGAKIADSAQDSGRDNLHTRIEPDRYERQLRLFREIVPFRKLGIVYEDSEAGRTYAAVDAVEKVSRELGFTVQHCHATSSSVSTDTAISNAVGCYRTLSQQRVDAVYVTSHRGVTPESIREIAKILVQAKIPSFSMAGSREVESGILLSLAQADLSYVGLFHAETIARIFNGAQPRQLSQLWIDPPKIALNLATSRAIGFDPPVDILLAADEVYEASR